MSIVSKLKKNTILSPEDKCLAFLSSVICGGGGETALMGACDCVQRAGRRPVKWPTGPRALQEEAAGLTDGEK